MPSQTRSSETDASYEPSEYADEFDVDPASTLAMDAETVVARVACLTERVLLDAHLQVEVDRQARSEVIGALNKRKQELDGCPRGCDDPIIDRLVSTASIEIQHEDTTYHRTCIVPRSIKGREGVELVYHDTSETEEPEPPEPEAETQPKADAESDDDDDDQDEDGPAGQRPKKLYAKMKSTDGTMNLAGIRGWAGSELDLSPDETKNVLDTLENDGYVGQVEDGVYRAPPPGQ